MMEDMIILRMQKADKYNQHIKEFLYVKGKSKIAYNEDCCDKSEPRAGGTTFY